MQREADLIDEDQSVVLVNNEQRTLEDWDNNVWRWDDDIMATETRCEVRARHLKQWLD